MYTFNIKNSGPDFKVIVTRGMLGIAALACFVYGNIPWFWSSAIGILLILAGVFTTQILNKYNLNHYTVLVIATVLLFLATHSFLFAFILLVYGVLVNYFRPKNRVEIGQDGVVIHKILSSPIHPWTELNNLVLKDNLLTIDFKNNQLLQLPIDSSINEIVEERAFNCFCARFIPASVSTG